MSSHSVVVEDLVADVSEVLFFRDHLPRPLLVGLGHALPQERVVLWISRCVCIEQLHPLIRCSLRSPGLMALHQLPPRLELGVTALRQTFLTAFGHTALGQKICRLGPDRISPVVLGCWPEGWGSKTHKSGDPVVGTPSVGAPSPKFRVFFPLPPQQKSFFLPSLGASFSGIVSGSRPRIHPQCAFGHCVKSRRRAVGVVHVRETWRQFYEKTPPPPFSLLREKT